MGNEERERKFEQALTRHLRRDGAGARDEAKARATGPGEAAGAVECPDAATLAAFHESMLSNEEMNATTEHIAACSRCQQILLLLEATDEIPLPVEAENDLKMDERLPLTGTSYAAAQTPSLADHAKPAMKKPTEISRGRGFKTLRWAAPAGAIAAGLLVWFVARDKTVQTLSHVDNVQVAQELRNEQLAAPRPLPTAPPPEPVAKNKRLNEPRKDNDRIKQPAEEPGALGAPKNSISDSIASRVDLGSGNRTSGANAPQVSRESRGEALQAAAPATPESRPSSEAKDAVASAAPARAAPRASDARTQSSAPVSEASGTAAKQSANTARAFETHTKGDVAQQVVTNDKLGLSRSLKRDGFENAKIILPPEGKVRWRLLSGGRIERSSDGGVTWLAQNGGVDVELLAGSAPSEAVCWIVGRGGTILRTTDGGGHWNQLVSPMGGDVAGVQALDAMTAEIFDASKSARFVTHDGGATWAAAKE